VGLAGCATKSDVDRLSEEIARLRIRQDSLAVAVRGMENSLATQMQEQRTALMTARGDLGRQLDDMERQLVQIQELLGQSQIVLRGLRERTESRSAGAETPGGVQPRDTTSPAESMEGEPAAAGAPGELYEAAMEQFRRGAYLTARSGFQEFLTAYPAHELAPQAQLHVAETFGAEGDNARAIREYNRVFELYPNSAAAPTALYKTGLLQTEQGNKDLACQYFQRVLDGFPRSDEARLARDQSERLSCR
jgi:tol-pal system protein YbgF